VLRDDLLAVLGRLDGHAGDLRAEAALQYIRGEINGMGNDAAWLRRVEEEHHLLPEVVRRATRRWHG
jgi:carboxylate-amine ligase